MDDDDLNALQRKVEDQQVLAASPTQLDAQLPAGGRAQAGPPHLDLGAAGAARRTVTFEPEKSVNSSSLVRFLPVSQYLLELAFGVWVLECGVLTSCEA